MKFVRATGSRVKIPPQRPGGFALVLVLGVLVLTSILILSYITVVRNNLSSTATYASGSSARALSEDVVQLVMSQIQDATTGPVDSGGTQHKYPGSPFSWASQPGMIRTYDTSGNGIMFYKLYSSDSMRAVWQDQGSYASATGMKDDLLTSDMSDPAQFTDLNSPVDNGSGTEVYPIADPNSLSTSTNPSATNPVAGFSTTGTVPTNVAGSTSNAYLPMPVRWLYVLQDGTLAAAPTGSNGTVNLASAGASASNPIVGRIAFWTDDETSKVNINTAGEGTYWDTPRFWGTSQNTINPSPPLTTTPYPDPEYAYAMSQPVQYEFQRYPGHPAQVALSPIFPNLLTKYTTASALAGAMANITPFLAPGGSEGGTLTIENPANLGANGALDLSKTDRDGPYATVDEFLYGTGMSGDSRNLTDTSGSVIDAATLQASKFFITANSRAPELNLFGLPRIACWPINSSFSLTNNPSGNAYTSVFDRLIAFCSSLKTGANSYEPYYFERSEPNDPTYDYSGIPDGRNPALYNYLDKLTSEAIPGFGGTFSAKYPVDRDQILTEIFDYIRCTDVADPSLVSAKTTFAVTATANSADNNATITYPITPIVGPSSTMGFGRTTVITQAGLCLICLADGNNIDYGPSNGGTNTNATLTAPYTKSPSLPIPDYQSIAQSAGITTQLTAGQKIVQSAFLISGYQPSFGPPEITPNFYLSISGLNSIQFQIGNTPISPFDPNITSQPFCARFYSGTGVVSGPELNPEVFSYGHNDWNGPTTRSYMPNSTATYTYTPAPAGPFLYPCISKPFLLPANSQISSVTSGTIQISLYPGNTVNGRLGAPSASGSYGTAYQTMSFSFPTTATMALFTPQLDTTDGTISDNWGFAHRITGETSFAGGNYLENPCFLWGRYDSTKSFFLASHGDWRLLAAGGATSPTPCTPNGVALDYTSTFAQFSHAFRDASESMFTATVDTSNSYIPGLSGLYPVEQNQRLHVPMTPWSGTTNNPPAIGDPSKGQLCYENGDFDNLIAAWEDGPGINKPDEGDSGGVGDNTIPYVSGFLTDTAARGATFFTPNRIMPSPGMFGSLPTGVKSNTPWQTLLFRPQPPIGGAANYYGHTEAAVPTIQTAYNAYTKPPDHLFMDLFWMPIVEPYAISDTFSTAGKINMNYQMMPFTYLDRNTSLVCLLKSEKLLAVPDADSKTYKALPNTEPSYNIFRFNINPSENGGSLRQFASRFAAGDIFRSPSEICDIFLVPATDENGTVSGWTSDLQAANWWGTHRLTGDNSRERPYTNLYGRLTTKSNTYTIHMRVQSLKQSVASRAAGKWVAGQDTIVGEYRGSTLIERYLDPSGTYTDYASNPNSANLDTFYKFRVVRTTQFSP